MLNTEVNRSAEISAERIAVFATHLAEELCGVWESQLADFCADDLTRASNPDYVDSRKDLNGMPEGGSI
jgi:hypothetical protein